MTSQLVAIGSESGHGIGHVIGTIRLVPYPYQAMVAICSDLDETPDRNVYIETARYLNTNEKTELGQGLGLEVGNTIYFDMPVDQFSYWNTDDRGREMVRALIRTGYIDCLHSYGDFATTREHAGRALDELNRHDCKMEVWVDHGQAPSNLGSDIMLGHGDVVGSSVYHADLTCGFGVKYVWRGRVTSVLGQDRARTLRHIFSHQHPLASGKTLFKEWLKGILARVGNAKYAMHGPNSLTRQVRLRDGHKAVEFIRSNPNWVGVDRLETPVGLPEVLSERTLSRLISRRAMSIIYTHLGKVGKNGGFGVLKGNIGLARLAECFKNKKILVTTTKRLLNYRSMINSIEIRGIRAEASEGCATSKIEISGVKSVEDLGGLTLYVSDARKTDVFVNGVAVQTLLRNPSNEAEFDTVSIPWVPLQFPEL